MREMGLLIKNQLIIAFKSERKGRRKNSRMSALGLWIIVIILMVFMVSVFSTSLVFVLKPAGLMRLLPAVMMAAACVFCLVTSVYKVNGLLFGFKDYDLLMSLPIPAHTIVSSRILMLYAYNMIYVLLIMVPSTVVYCIAETQPAAFYPIFIVCLLCVPMIPVIIATAIGTLIAYISSFFKRKSGANVVFTVIFLIVWILFCTSMDNIVDGFARLGPQITDVIYKVYPLAQWYTQAVCDFNMISFALFVAISIACWAVFAVFIGKKFKYLNSVITSDRSKSKYKMQELKTESPDKALFQRELKRLTSSSQYLLNAAISPIMGVIFSVIICVLGARGLNIFFEGDDMGELGELGANMITWAVPFFISLFTGMTLTSACSISLEGSKLWIIKTLPVTSKQILNAKIKLNLVIGIPLSLACSVLLTIGLKPPVYAVPAYFLLPITYSLFSTMFGMVLNLAYPNFEWDSEIMIVKRSTPVMIVTFVDMGMAFAGMLASFALGGVFTYCVIAALLVITLLLYRNIMTRGVRKFDKMEG